MTRFSSWVALVPVLLSHTRLLLLRRSFCLSVMKYRNFGMTYGARARTAGARRLPPRTMLARNIETLLYDTFMSVWERGGYLTRRV